MQPWLDALGARGKGRESNLVCAKMYFRQRLSVGQVGAVPQYQVDTLKGSPSSLTFCAIALETLCPALNCGRRGLTFGQIDK